VDYVSAPNSGVIQIGDAVPNPDEPCTLIVTGVARSGTSMLASVLQIGGVFMGQHLYDVVMEDAEILHALHGGHEALLRRVIERRDAEHRAWGFKIPNLPAYLLVEQLRWFRNPRLVVIYRDPVAIAVRGSLSEYFDVREELTSAGHAVNSLTAFIARAQCPTLILSYEKAIARPDVMLDALLPFCGITPDVDMMEEQIRAVLPNNPAYLATANTQFVGYVEGLLRDQIYGWCYRLGSLEPVLLDLFADDVRIATFLAGEFRKDLAENKIGNGNHGFYFDLSRFNLSPDTTLRIRPNRRTVELNGSGRALRDLTMADAGGEPPDPASASPASASPASANPASVSPTPAPAGVPIPATVC
jgi:hypothetical protein